MEGEETKKEIISLDATTPPPASTVAEDEDSSSESSGFQTPPETVSTDNRNDETGFIVSDVTTLLKRLDTEGVLDKKIGIIESDEEGGGEVAFEDVEFDDLPNLSQLQSQDTTGDSNTLLNKIEHFLDEEVDHIQPHPQIDQQQFDIRYRKDDESHPQDEDNETHPQDKDNETHPQDENNETHPQDEDNETHPQDEDDESHPQDEDNETHPQDNEMHPQDEDNETHPQDEDNETHPQDNEMHPQDKDNEMHPQDEDNESHPQDEDNETHPQDNEMHPQDKDNEMHPQDEDNESHPQDEDNEPHPQDEDDSQEDHTEEIKASTEIENEHFRKETEPHPPEQQLILKDDKSTMTEILEQNEANTQTSCNEVTITGTQTIPASLNTTSTMTSLDINELIQLANIGRQRKEREDNFQSIMAELNQERSQRLVNDQLVKILENDLTSLQQRNVMEVSERLKLENEISDLKAEYAHSQNELKDSQTRVTELEESLSGTLLLVRKLEEQSATITNKGGVDYLLQAKIADGRAQEAEQQLQVLQAELLQSQSEVKRLLDRINELSRGRQEMVSGIVHTQLLELSDQRAEEAERRVRELEQEVLLLKSGRDRGGRYTSPYNSSFNYLTGSSLTMGGYSTSSLTMGGYPSMYSSGTASDVKGYYDFTGAREGEFPFKPREDEVSFPTSMKDEGFSLHHSHKSGESFANRTNYTRTNTTEDNSSFSSFLKNQNSSTHWLQETTPTTFSPPKDATPTTSLLSPVKEATPPTTLPSLLLPPINHTTTSEEGVESTNLMNNSKDDESDSDWSSSEGEEDDSGDGDMLRPTAHMNLLSKFEWLSSQNPTPTQQQAPPTTLPHDESSEQALPVPSEVVGRKAPPPIAPKPKSLLRRSVSADIKGEGPVSFDEIMKPPSLKIFVRPRGPRGRRPPTGY